MIPLTLTQKIRLALQIGKKILAAKNEHDTKEALESHNYLSAKEKVAEAKVPTEEQFKLLMLSAKSEILWQNTLHAPQIILTISRVNEPDTKGILGFITTSEYKLDSFGQPCFYSKATTIPLDGHRIEMLRFLLKELLPTQENSDA